MNTVIEVRPRFDPALGAQASGRVLRQMPLTRKLALLALLAFLTIASIFSVQLQEPGNRASIYGVGLGAEIVSLNRGAGIRAGPFVHPVEDDVLPEGLTPDAFRAQLDAWRAA